MSTPATEGSPSSTRRSWLGTGLLILVLPIAVCLMLLAFLTPALNSGPKDLPLAVAGPAPGRRADHRCARGALPRRLRDHRVRRRRAG